jgi:hypothetical protein
MPEALRVFLISLAWVGFVGVLVALVRRARAGGKGMQALGMTMMMLFGLGITRDPREGAVAETEDGRIRKGNESGDPPDPA